MNSRMSVLLSAALMLVLSGIASAAELVNINKADAAALQQSLLGIGPIKAEAIVSYRKKNGKYSSISDLENVRGIGPALLKKNKKYLSLNKGLSKGDAKAYAAAKKAAGPAKKKSVKTAKKTKPATTTTAKPAKKTSKKPASTTKPAKKPAAKPAKKPAKKDKKPVKKGKQPVKKDKKKKKKKTKPAS